MLGLVNQGANLCFPAHCIWGERNISPNPASKIPPLALTMKLMRTRRLAYLTVPVIEAPLSRLGVAVELVQVVVEVKRARAQEPEGIRKLLNMVKM